MPRGQKLEISKDELYQLYIVDKKRQQEIADNYQCTVGAISLQLKKFGLRHNTIYKYIGNTFGSLTPVEHVGQDNNSHKLFKCKCQCGKFVVRTGYSLLTGNTKSCGCTSRKKGKKHHLWKGYEDIPSTTISSLKKGAMSRGLIWNITSKNMWDLYLKQNKRCRLTNLPIYFAKTRKKYTQQTASLDRIDSSKGYTIDNVQWVHKNINKMKQNLSEQEFIEFCGYVSKFRGASNDLCRT